MKLCKVDRDEHGTTYVIPAAETGKTPGGLRTLGSAELQVWWARKFRGRADETLLIRQENNTKSADCIQLTLGQLFALIEAANAAVEDI